MGRFSSLGLLALVALLASGCAMCCSPYDEAYGYSGGRWQRTDLCSGRVGSAFAPAGAEGDIIIEGAPDELPPPAPSPPANQGPLKSIKKSSDWSGDLMSE